MNRGILNIEVFGADRLNYALGYLHTSLKNKRAYFSVPPGGTQVLSKTNYVFIWMKFFQLSRTYLSLERDRFQLAVNQRKGSDGLGMNVFQVQSSIINLKL